MICPICKKENTLTLCYLYQYSHNYRILKNGKVSKKYTVEDSGGGEEKSVLTCSNGCLINNLYWYIDNNDNLIIENSVRPELRN